MVGVHLCIAACSESAQLDGGVCPQVTDWCVHILKSCSVQPCVAMCSRPQLLDTQLVPGSPVHKCVQFVCALD